MAFIFLQNQAKQYILNYLNNDLQNGWTFKINNDMDNPIIIFSKSFNKESISYVSLELLFWYTKKRNYYYVHMMKLFLKEIFLMYGFIIKLDSEEHNVLCTHIIPIFGNNKNRIFNVLLICKCKNYDDDNMWKHKLAIRKNIVDLDFEFYLKQSSLLLLMNPIKFINNLDKINLSTDDDINAIILNGIESKINIMDKILLIKLISENNLENMDVCNIIINFIMLTY